MMYNSFIDAVLFFIGGGAVGIIISAALLVPEIDALRNKLRDLKAANAYLRRLLTKAGVIIK